MNIALIGASRGLGRSFALHLQSHLPDVRLLIVGRRPANLEKLKEDIPTATLSACDLSREEEQTRMLQVVRQFHTQRLFYFAGGGPYGVFEKKEWKDHMWAWQVSFLAAARVLHDLHQETEQLVIVGSAIAEDRPDPQAASYAAAKHALKGLVTTLQQEHPERDLRLYSPGYMDTQLLPPGAVARQAEVARPEAVANDLFTWCWDSSTRGGHRSFAI